MSEKKSTNESWLNSISLFSFQGPGVVQDVCSETENMSLLIKGADVQTFRLGRVVVLGLSNF